MTAVWITVGVAGWAVLLYGGYRFVKWLIVDPLNDNDRRQGGPS